MDLMLCTKTKITGVAGLKHFHLADFSQQESRLDIAQEGDLTWRRSVKFCSRGPTAQLPPGRRGAYGLRKFWELAWSCRPSLARFKAEGPTPKVSWDIEEPLEDFESFVIEEGESEAVGPDPAF